MTGSLGGVFTVGAWDFTAKSRSWENFPRIAETFWIEGASNTLHRVKIVIIEHFRQVFCFVDDETMLTRDRTTSFDAVGKYLRSDTLG